MAGWTADFFRLVWGLFYWNGRKTLFRLRPGSRNPCQSASDSGKAYETHCEACVMWARPGRFRRVCPLLVETPKGLRCSVNAADVRPFWGLAFRRLGFGAAALYLMVTLALFATYRAIGYPVSYATFAWPPAWSRIGVVRAQYFMRKGAAALAAGNIKEALLSLSSAYELAPHDYDIGFTLASLWQITQPGLSDRLYARLLAEHPAQHDRTADAWHRALLARSDYAQIKELAAAEFRRMDPAHAGYWMNSLLFATRQTGDDLPLRRLLAGPGPLPPQWRKVVETELLIRTGQQSQAIAGLSQVWADASHPFVPFFQARSLLELRQPRLALELVAKYGSAIRDNERYSIRLDAFAELGWQSLLDSDVTLLLTAPPTGPVIELIGTHLAKHPNAAVLDRVFARLQASPLPPARENHNAFAALFCAAGIAGDFGKMHAMARQLDATSNSSSLTVAGFEDFFQGKPPPRHIEAFLPSLPLSLELTYALLTRYSAGHPIVPATARS
ncbi:MAG TPA: hypothetical protein VG838_12340 [Opitutaceae bacterium]|nr:hypothetical protein [Opitutaceae bacterium]